MEVAGGNAEPRVRAFGEIMRQIRFLLKEPFRQSQRLQSLYHLPGNTFVLVPHTGPECHMSTTSPIAQRRKLRRPQWSMQQTNARPLLPLGRDP